MLGFFGMENQGDLIYSIDGVSVTIKWLPSPIEPGQQDPGGKWVIINHKDGTISEGFDDKISAIKAVNGNNNQ